MKLLNVHILFKKYRMGHIIQNTFAGRKLGTTDTVQIVQ